MLPEHLRFSRALILIGSAFALLLTFLNRILCHFIIFIPVEFKKSKKHKLVIIGLRGEIDRVKQIISESEIKPSIIGFVAPAVNQKENYHIGEIQQIQEIIKIHKIDEVVFCAKDIASNQIISVMLKLAAYNIDYKIAQPDTLSIIGSNSIETAGELYTVDINSISKKDNIRNKRFFDITASLSILIFSPLIFLLSKIRFKFINNSLNVLLGLKTWVGYYDQGDANINALPKIKHGILTPLDLVKKKDYSKSFIENSNMAYAKDYTVKTDLNILLKGFKHIDR